MTPTLFGRWQTRILLLITVGALMTLPFALGLVGPGATPRFFWVLGYIALFGLGWDLLYNYLHRLRWDYDWPALFQLLAGIGEAVFLTLLLSTTGLPGLPAGAVPLSWFVLHYSLVWLAVFIVSQSIMRIWFPRWRFRGGEWL